MTLPAHLRATLTVTAFVLLGALTLARDHPTPPTILHARHVQTESEPFAVDVWSDPHPDRRSVLLELWQVEASDEGDPDLDGQHYIFGPLVTGSVREVNEKNRDQKVFHFDWDPVGEGTYALMARVGAARGLTFSAPMYLVEVR